MSERLILKRAKNNFELQQEESDCGVAALASVIQFFGGYSPLETLRSLSGTTTTGTTMLGLMQAANQVGLLSEAFEADLEELKKLKSPVILHVLKDGNLEHFVVCYQFNGSRFLIGDPESGIEYKTSEELEVIWVSKALLTFQIGEDFLLKKKITRAKYAWLLEVLDKDKRFLISASIVGMIVSILSFSTAIFTEKLIDNLIPSNNPATTLIGLVTWLLLLFAKLLFNYIRELILIKQGYNFTIGINESFIKKIMSLPKSFFDSRKKGDLIARLFDTNRIQTSVSAIISQDIIDLLSLLVALILMLFYKTEIAFFLILLIPAYFIIIHTYYSKLYFVNKDLMRSFSFNESAYIDKLTGIEAIKQQGKADSEGSILIDNFSRFQDKVVTSEKLRANFRLVSDSFGALSIFFIFIYCITAVLSKTLQIGDMIAIFSISSIALGSTNRLAFSVTHLQETRAALDRTYDIIAIKSEPQIGAELNNVSFISVEKLTFRFPGHNLLFEDINFKIKKSEITILLGSNGSGKSTILQIIQGFYKPERGSIYFGHTDLSMISASSLRKTIGVVPQNIKIFNQSLGYNICLDSKHPEHQIMSFIQTYELDSFIESFSDGINTILGEEGVNASGGQKQLIGLARALYNKPQFLLLDEFTASMDAVTKEFSIKMIKMLKISGLGIFIITHDSDLVSIASNKILLK